MNRQLSTLFVLAMGCNLAQEPPSISPRPERPKSSLPTTAAAQPSIVVKPRCPLVPVTTIDKGRVGAYERLAAPESEHEIWHHKGKGIKVSGRALYALIDADHSSKLLKLKGVYGTAESMCCGSEPAADYSCLFVSVEPSEIDAAELARGLEAVFTEAEHIDYDIIVYGEGLVQLGTSR